jgi:hypothetical protein
MQRWMRTRVLRTVGLLFGLTLMLSACSGIGDLPGLIGGGDPPAGEESEPVPDEVGDDGDGSEEVSSESEPGDVSDESEPEEEEDDGHEHQCLRDRAGDDAEEDEAGAEETDEAADETI